PYRGYRGPLPDGAEAPLFRQARVCPTINEPTVRLLHGQINERVFKVLGSGGLAAVDAIPAYRDLFGEDELFVPRNLSEFHAFVDGVLRDEGERRRWVEAGRRAVLDRHCYVHRARELARHLGFGSLA
ncbi:MAG: glycosyltransferase family protein, partial [Myxococcota bacterium]